MARPRIHVADGDTIICNLAAEIAAWRVDHARSVEAYRDQQHAESVESWERRGRKDYRGQPTPRPMRSNEITLPADFVEVRKIEEGWLPYSLPMLTGQDGLSESAKQVWRKEINRLEHDGLVEIRGAKATEIRLSESGKQRVAELTKQAETESSE